MKERLRIIIGTQSHGEWRPVPVIVFKYLYTADMLNMLDVFGRAWERNDYDLYDRMFAVLNNARP